MATIDFITASLIGSRALAAYGDVDGPSAANNLNVARKSCSAPKPTVCLGVTSAMVYTYGCGDGRIGPTRCALIDGALGDRCSRCRVCRTPRAAGGSGRSGLVAESRRVSIADPAGFHRSRTTPQSETRPCGDASPPKWVGSGRVTLRHVSPIPPLDPYVRLSPHTAHDRGILWERSISPAPRCIPHGQLCAFAGYLCTVFPHSDSSALFDCL